MLTLRKGFSVMRANSEKDEALLVEKLMRRLPQKKELVQFLNQCFENMGKRHQMTFHRIHIGFSPKYGLSVANITHIKSEEEFFFTLSEILAYKFYEYQKIRTEKEVYRFLIYL